MKESGIYKITCIPTGKVYVGSALNLKERWRTHRKELYKLKHRNRYLQNAWSKYGEIAFKFDVLEIVTGVAKLCEREQYWMDILEVTDRSKGFNLTPKAGSSLGIKHRVETIEKLSKFTQTDIMSIRKDLSDGISGNSIAKRYNVKRSTINMIKCGKSWNLLPISTFLAGPRVGKNHWKASLDNDKVKQIKTYLASGMDCKHIGDIFGVKRKTISDIKLGKTWKQVI